MSTYFNAEDERQLQHRSPFARPDPIPGIRLEALLQERAPSLVARQVSSSTSSTSSGTITCGPKDTTGPCERSVSSSNTNTIPIILGVVLPLGVALVVLLVLHRRHVKKLRQEDAEDRHKSLDFGLGTARPRVPKKGGKIPEMSESDTHNAIRRDRGMSMDMNMNSPYLLPPELHSSRESLHSLSRSTNQGDDKYRNTSFIPDDGSIRSPSVARSPLDDSSSFTGSSRRRFDTESNKTLLRNVQGSTKSGVSGKHEQDTADDLPQMPRKPLPPQKNSLLPPPMMEASRDSFVSTTSDRGNAAAFRKSNNYLGALIRGGSPVGAIDDKERSGKTSPMAATEIRVETPAEDIRPPPAVALKEDEYTRSNARGDLSGARSAAPSNEPDRQARLPQLSFIDSFDEKQDMLLPEISAPNHLSAAQQETNPSHNQHQSSYEQQQYGQSDSYAQQQIGDQTQPQQYETEDDYYDEEDTYSVYDDYTDELGYDPRRLTMGMRPLPPDDPTENPEQRANRIRSFYKEYFDDNNKSPNPQPMTYYDGSEYYDDYYGNQGYFDQGHHPHRGPSADGYGRQRAFSSNGSYSGGPRAYSSASGRYAQPAHRQGGRHMPPKKNLPPPKPLHILPTPHKLKDDLFMPTDFAPPNLARLQRAGTPDDLRGGVRPYSPSARAHTPLVSAFDDLAVMPSPHQLRKSATFTALDFAPPPRIMRGGDSGSDSGSIRSNRSGMSAMHLHNIRNGAYRLSRIPKEVAGTRNELSESLKPKWDMNR